MAENNFYEWLELSVEHFESDPAKLAPILEKKITEWNSSKSIQLQNRAAINQTAMRTAIQDPDAWKKIYLEYKDLIDNKITDALVMCADNMEVESDQIVAIAKSCKVSIGYVETIAKKKGFIIGKRQKTDEKYTIKDLEPDSKIKNQLDSIQKSINELGYPTLAELISHETNTETDLFTVTKDSVLDALKDIKKHWSKVSASNKEKYQQKSHIDRICSGMMAFLKSYDIKDYIEYLNWKSVNDILNDLRAQLNSLALDSLNDTKFNNTIDSIFSVIGDREKSKSILESYCDEKNIAYPKPLPNVAVCPFCSNGFEKKKPMQENCPSCGRSFVVKCPKCGKPKNIIADSNCDEIDLLQYPYLEKQLQEAQNVLESLNFTIVKNRVSQIQQKWPNFPGTPELLSRCQTIEGIYGKDLLKLRQLCDVHKYYEARTICDRISGTYPNFKKSYQWIYDTVAKAEKMFKSVVSIKDDDKKIELLLGIMELVSDYSEVKIELGKQHIENIDSMSVQVNEKSKTAVLSWKSKNKPNSVQYYVIKKKGAVVSNASDGEELTVTQSLSYSDTDLIEGQLYFYAVYAKRGPQETPICVTKDATVFLKKPIVSVNPKDSGVSVSWENSSIDIKVFYSESQINKFGDGTPCSNVTSTGVDIEGLQNGRRYYIGVYKVSSYMGKQIQSEGEITTITPMELIEPPSIMKAIGKIDGEYIITHTNPKSNSNFELYYSAAQAKITSNSSVGMAEIRRLLRKASATDIGNNQYIVNMNGATEMYIYPVVGRGDTATVGNYICLRYAKGIKITKSVVSGNKLRMYIDNWVSGADALIICYNDDVYPENKDDSDKRISVSKLEYERTRLLEINNIQNQKYYISIFARKSGEYIPVCNHYFDNSNSEKTIIKYYFQVSLFGGVSIVFENNAVSLPEINVCVNEGCMPLTKSGGTIVEIIAAGTNGEAGIKIKNLKASDKKYARLFTDNPNYQLTLSKGDGRLKK